MYVEMRPSGGNEFRRGHESGDEISVLRRVDTTELVLSPLSLSVSHTKQRPREYTVRRLPAATQGEPSHQEAPIPSPCSDFQLPEL